MYNKNVCSPLFLHKFSRRNLVRKYQFTSSPIEYVVVFDFVRDTFDFVESPEWPVNYRWLSGESTMCVSYMNWTILTHKTEKNYLFFSLLVSPSTLGQTWSTSKAAFARNEFTEWFINIDDDEYGADSGSFPARAGRLARWWWIVHVHDACTLEASPARALSICCRFHTQASSVSCRLLLLVESCGRVGYGTSKNAKD